MNLNSSIYVPGRWMSVYLSSLKIDRTLFISKMCQNTSNRELKYRLMQKRNGVIVRKRYKVQSPNMTFTFEPLTPKSIEVLLGSCSIHVWSIIIVCQKGKQLSCGNVKTSKFKHGLELWTIDPKINRSPFRVMANTYVKYHYCVPKGNGVIMRKR